MIQNIYTSFDTEYKTKQKTKKQKQSLPCQWANGPMGHWAFGPLGHWAIGTTENNKQKKRLSSLFNYLSAPRLMLSYQR